MSREKNFGNLVPILKDKKSLSLLYSFNNQIELENFLEKKGIHLSIEEIEKLWDIIEVCKPSHISYSDDCESDIEENEDKSLKSTRLLSDDELDISGGKGIFYDRIDKIIKILE